MTKSYDELIRDISPFFAEKKKAETLLRKVLAYNPANEYLLPALEELYDEQAMLREIRETKGTPHTLGGLEARLEGNPNPALHSEEINTLAEPGRNVAAGTCRVWRSYFGSHR